MIVTEFQLDRFHGGNPLRALDLGDGLNVALVRSAAGRAQLLNVIPTALCGPAEFFWHGDDEQFAHDLSGIVVVRTERGVFRIHRDSDEGLCVIHGADDEPYDASSLEDLLDGVGLKEYRDVFTFNLDRLRRLVSRERQSAPRLLKMARSLHRFAPPQVEELPAPQFAAAASDLSGAAEALDALQIVLKQQATVPEVGEVAKPRTTQDRERVTRDLKKVDASIGDLQTKIEFVQKEIDETQCAMALSRTRSRLAAISRELAELADGVTPQAITDINEGSIERLDLKLAECKQQLKQLTDERDELARQGKQLARDDRAAKFVTIIESTLLHEKSSIKDAEAIDRLKLKIEDLETRLEDQQRDVNQAMQLRSSSVSSESRVVSRLDTLAERLREAERHHELAEQRLSQAESLALGSGAHVVQTSGNLRPEDGFALHDAEQRVLQLRERLSRDGDWGQLQEERQAAVEDLRYLHDAQLLPFQTILVLGVPFVAGVAMVIYGTTQFQPHANWRLVSAGLLTAGAVSLIKFMLDRDRSDVIYRARLKLAQIDDELQQHTADEAGGADREFLRTQLADAEDHLADLQSRVNSASNWAPDLTAPRDHVSVDLARGQLQDAQRKLRDLNQQWRDLLIDLSLSPTLTPALAREALAQRALNTSPLSDNHSTQLEMQLAAARAEVDVRTDWQTIVAGKLRQLLKDLALPSGGSLAEQFQTLRDAYTDYNERRQTRRQLAREIRKIRAKARQVQEAGRRHNTQRQQLAAEVARKKLQQKYLADSRADARRLLQQQRELIDQDIEEIQHRYGVDGKSPLADLTDDELRSRLSEQLDKIANFRDKCQRQAEQRGRLRALLTGDVEEANTATIAVDWTSIFEHTKQLRDQLQNQVAVRTAPKAKAAVRTARSLYLEKAAHYLNQFSGGQLVGLDVTDDELVVCDAQNATAVGEVHPNHYANIYFSLWLARIEAYADRGIRLPIVLEDPLESTRDHRRGVIADLLTEFAARGHQLILVTSQPANAREFAKRGVPIADFSKREPVPQYDDEQLNETTYVGERESRIAGQVS